MAQEERLWRGQGQQRERCGKDNKLRQAIPSGIVRPSFARPWRTVPARQDAKERYLFPQVISLCIAEQSDKLLQFGDIAAEDLPLCVFIAFGKCRQLSELACWLSLFLFFYFNRQCLCKFIDTGWLSPCCLLRAHYTPVCRSNPGASWIASPPCQQASPTACSIHEPTDENYYRRHQNITDCRLSCKVKLYHKTFT